MCLIIICALYNHQPKRKRSEALKSIDQSSFRRQVKNGDLLGTRSSVNWMSRIHSMFLVTPIAHVGIAVVEEEENPHGKIYMFESGAPRGAQLRDIDDYMGDGAECLWWRSLSVSQDIRNDIVKEIERASNLAYSWSFLKTIPHEMSGLDAPGQMEFEEEASSCGDIIAKVYVRAKVFTHLSKTLWLPMHFLEDLPVDERFKVNEPVNIIFGKIEDDKYRWSSSISNLALAMKNELL
jgi:hypothetical protein